MWQRRAWCLAGVLGLASGCGLLAAEGEGGRAEAPAASAEEVEMVASRIDQPEELGQVRWGRDLEAALARGASEGKPVLVLFDEVPGCHTVLAFGREVLSHPLVVEAAETLFVPVVVYNNVEGRDREVLESFGEPTWNNPVVRIITPTREALAPRLDGDWTVAGLTGAMVTALERQGGGAPPWLKVLEEEASARREGTARATFGMYCFWSGEAGLGRADGVVGTRTGFLGGSEVVEVEYDPRVVRYEGLVRYAQQSGAGEVAFAGDAAELEVARAVYGERVRQASGAVRPSPGDDKYQLAHTPWAYVPMTGLQATRANALLGLRKDPAEVFSPRQRALYRVVAAHPEAGWSRHLGVGDLQAAWSSAVALSPGAP